jgi:hypothetical protein
MAFLGRRRRLPNRLRPPLERDERVLAWAETVTAGPGAGTGAAGVRAGGVPVGGAGAADVPAADLPAGDLPAGGTGGGRALVATNRGLWVPMDPPGRLGWHEINKATWSEDKLAVTAARVAGSGAGYDIVEDLPTVAFALATPGDLPAEVRARVTRSVGPTSHHPLPGGGGARVAARRVPGVDGLRWTVRYDSEVDHDDPVVREATEQLVAQARAGAEVQP